MKTNRKNLLLAATIAFTLTAPSAFAVPYYWDIDDATPGSGGATPSGSWATGGLTWSTDSTGATATSAVTTLAADDLTFSAGTDATGAYAIALGANQNAKSLTFEEGTATISAANTLTLASGIGGGGITVQAGAGDVTLSSNLTIAGGTTFNVGAGRLLTLDTGTFTRGTRAALNVQGLGNGSSTMTGLSSNVNNIVGPWASVGTGPTTTYVKLGISGNVDGLGYTGGTDGENAAVSTDVITGAGNLNYNLGAVGALGSPAAINTLRYSGAAGIITGNLTTLGIMQAGGGVLNFTSAVSAGTSATEMVINTANGDILISTGTGLFTGAINKTGPGTLTLSSGAAHSIGAFTVNEGVLVASSSAGDALVNGTVNNGGTLKFGAGNKFSNTTTITVNAGGTFDLSGFGDTIGAIAGAGSVTTTSGTPALSFASTTATFSGVISGTMGITTSNASSAITLSGANTYTRPTTLTAGTLTLNNANALGGNNPGVNGTSGITLNAAATLRDNFVGGTGNIYAPITLSGTGNATIMAGGGTGTATNTNIAGAIGGTITGSLIFTTQTGSQNNNVPLITLGATGTYGGNTTITTGNTTGNNNLTVRAGALNGLAPATVLTMAGGPASNTSGGRTVSYNMNGNNQTLAGLTNTTADHLTTRNQRVTNSGTLATLTINNATDFSYGGAGTDADGTGSAQITGAIALTKSGAGTFTLGGALTGTATTANAPGNSFTGDTKILGGILVLGVTRSIQNSTFDTTNSILGAAGDGLRTAVTTLTLGGLSGSNDFASRFTTTTGGYGGVTALTLNPGTGATPSYSGILADGATGMTVTKSGVGTQTLAGANSFTGATTVNAGNLTLDYSTQDNSKLSDTAALILGGGTLNLSGGTHTEIVASTTLTAGTVSRITRSSGTALLQMGLITPGVSATVDFGASGIATIDNLNNAYGILGPWATVNGVLAINSTNGVGGLLTPSVSSDVTRLDGGLQVIADGSTNNIRIIEGTGTAANITLGAATTTVNTLFQSAFGGASPATIDSGAQILRTNAVIVGTGAGALTIGNGTLAPAVVGGVLELANTTASAFTVNSVIADFTSPSSVTKTGSGSVTLAGDNTFTGATTVNLGTLAVTHNNALGTIAGATTINGGNGSNAVTLSLSSATSDLTIAEPLNFNGSTAGRAQLVNSSAQNHTLSGPINVSSDTNLVQFLSGSTGSITVSGDITGTFTNDAILFLRGTSTSANNQLTGSINLTGDDLSKTDVGTWTVGASGETYSWLNTTVANGILKMGAANVLPSTTVLTMGNPTGGSTGNLDLNGFNQTVSGLIYSGQGVTTGNRPITSATPATLTVNNATDFITTGTNASTNNVVLTGALALTKQGAGRLALNGVNTNSGNTTVSEGILSLTKAASALDANINNNASTVTIAVSGATLDLTYTGTDIVANLFFGAAQQPAGIYSSSSVPAGATITTASFLGSGTLTVVGGFSSWITGTFINGTVPALQQGPNDDPDNDGISNLVEFAVAGQDPTVANPSIGTFTNGTLSFTKRLPLAASLTYAIQDSTDLGISVPWTAVTGTPPTYVNDGTTISYTLTPGTPAKNFIRLQVLSN